MNTYTLDAIYTQLKQSLKDVIETNGLSGNAMSIRCKALETVEAIGNPQDNDYPVQTGREYMVEARIGTSRGQAFADNFEPFNAPVESLIDFDTSTVGRRAAFIAGLNAVYRLCGICKITVHCRDEEPRDCAMHLPEIFKKGQNVALIGLQPRFLEQLAKICNVRTIDLDKRTIGSVRSEITIEGPEKTLDAIDWCDTLFVTGSTIVNGSIVTFLNAGKRVIFFGVTITAPACILGLQTYCHAPVR
jgi:hypothetical protein